MNVKRDPPQAKQQQGTKKQSSADTAAKNQSMLVLPVLLFFTRLNRLPFLLIRWLAY